MDGNRVWGVGRKRVEGVCGEGSVWVRSGFGVGWGKKRCWRRDGETWNGVGKELEE